jgi:hypothetical protein
MSCVPFSQTFPRSAREAEESDAKMSCVPFPFPEELIAAEIARLRSEGRTVVTLELFTERIPCSSSGGCRAMMAEHLPEARVFFYTRATDSATRVSELWSIYSR